MVSDLPRMPDLAGQLQDVLSRVGRERMITRVALTRNVLKDLFPAEQLAVSLLVAAVEHGSVAALDQQGTTVDPALLMPRLAHDLARSRGLSIENATWAIAAWAQALGLSEMRRPEAAPTHQLPTQPLATEPVPPDGPLAGTVVGPSAPAQTPGRPTPAPMAPGRPPPAPMTPAPARPPPATPPRRRARVALLAGLTAVLLGAAGIVWWVSRPDGSSRPALSEVTVKQGAKDGSADLQYTLDKTSDTRFVYCSYTATAGTGSCGSWHVEGSQPRRQQANVALPAGAASSVRVYACSRATQTYAGEFCAAHAPATVTTLAPPGPPVAQNCTFDFVKNELQWSWNPPITVHRSIARYRVALDGAAPVDQSPSVLVSHPPTDGKQHHLSVLALDSAGELGTVTSITCSGPRLLSAINDARGDAAVPQGAAPTDLVSARAVQYSERISFSVEFAKIVPAYLNIHLDVDANRATGCGDYSDLGEESGVNITVDPKHRVEAGGTSYTQGCGSGFDAAPSAITLSGTTITTVVSTVGWHPAAAGIQAEIICFASYSDGSLAESDSLPDRGDRAWTIRLSA